MEFSNLPLKIAITGGICSGKTTILEWLEEKEYYVFQADKIGHKVLQDPDILNKVTDVFGEKILTDNNHSIDRKKLAKIVFKNTSHLRELNSILHPEIILAIDRIIDSHRDKRMIIFEIPLLFETNIHSKFDLIINVSVTDEVRFSRIKKRYPDFWESVLTRAKFQISESERSKKADLNIDNNGSQIDLYNQLNILDFFLPAYRNLILTDN